MSPKRKPSLTSNHRARQTECWLLLAIGLLVLTCKPRESGAGKRYDDAPVIIISIDTLRADHLPMFGYRQVDTPHLDALRGDSILFTNAYSSVPLTFPSHTAMLTGLLPPENKVRNNIGYSLDPALPTLPKALKARGYDTGAAISAYVLRGNIGLSAAFDYYEDGIVSKANVPVGSLQRSGFETESIAERWVIAHKSRPFFFLLHLFEPHSPYEPPEPFLSRYKSPYDGEIATADQIVGQFVDALKKEQIYDRAVIVLMSDHGEGLYQHGEPEHGVFVYRETLHVPLMVKLPAASRAGETDPAPVSLIDIFPTVAELTGAPKPANLKGRSLLHHSPADSSRRVYAESLYGRIHLGWSELRTLIGGDYQFIQAPKPELYNVTTDPEETHNVLTEERRVYASMRDELGAFGSQIDLPTHIDPEEAKKLAALGYLGSSAGTPSGPLPDPKDRIGEIAAMMSAARLAHEGHQEEAAAAFRALVTQNPRLADAWNQLGDALEATGRYEEAAAAYRKAIEMTPELAGEFGLRLGSVLLKLEKFDEAEKHAELGEKTNLGGSHVLRARIALARKDYPRAESEAKKAAADQYSRVPAMVLLAQVYAQQERAPEAYALAEQIRKEAEERHLGPVESLEFVRGDALARMQRYDEAIAAFQREMELFPHDRLAYANLYLVYMLTGRAAEGHAVLAAMVKANPNKRAMLSAAHAAEALHDQATAAFWQERAREAR